MFLILSSSIFALNTLTTNVGGVIGNCPTGFFIQNITSTTIQCAMSAGSGTVTQVNSGTGLLGGPISTTGTLSIDMSFLVTSLGNWSLDKTLYATTQSVSNIGNWTNEKSLYATTQSVSNIGNYTSAQSTIATTGTCPAGQVVQNLTTSGPQCVVDQTSGGSSSIPILIDAKRQPFDIRTNNITAWNMTNLNFSVVENTNYSLECTLLYTGNAAGTGQALNLSAFFRANNVTISYQTWSSATASVTLSANVFNTSLLGTGSGAAIILQNKVKADFQALSSGILAPQIRSELATTNLSTLKQGSTCFLYNMTGRS